MRFEPMEMRHWEWVQERLPVVSMSDTQGIAAILEDEIVGVCVLDSWSPNSVQMHIAIDNPVCLRNGEFQYEVFNFIFNTTGRKIALGTVRSDNRAALNFDKKLGFKEVARIKDGWSDGVDSIVLELRKEDCRWINHGKEKLSSTA